MKSGGIVTRFSVFFIAANISFAAASEEKTFTTAQICKAGIATVMGRDPATMKVYRTQGAVLFISYVRSDDRSVWKYKCKLDGSQIMWGDDNGRWRDHSLDSPVFYSISGDRLEVVEKYSDGSSTREEFSRANLK